MDTNLKLQQALTRLETGDISVSKLEGFLSEPSISNDIKWFLKHIDDETIPIEQIDKLRMILDVAMYIYDVSGADTGISDSDYDKLSEFYQRISKDYHFTPRNPSSSKVPHSYPVLRGTLQKIYSLGKQDISNKVNSHRATLEEWVKQKENYIFSNTGKHVNLFDEFVYVFPKWDGCSCIFEFDEHGNLLRALTRGDVSLNLAQDITHHFKGIRGHDYGVPYGEKTEIMVRDTDLDDYNAKYGKDYKQTRSIASAIINSKDSDERDNLLVRKMLREIRKGEGDIERLCPEVFDDPYIKCQLRDIDKIIDFSIDHQNGFRCDGSVIYFIDQKIQSLLGRHDDRNWFEVAYKFTEEYTYSHVVDMHFQMGPMGRLTPVVEVEPVKLKGNIISRISLGSMARFRALQLSKGDKVKILYDIVPYLDIDKKCNISHEDSFPEPRYCPECGSILHRDGDVVSCQSKDCPWVQKGQIVNYLMKRNVVGISFMTVGTLYDLGFINDISDLYKLHEVDDVLCKIDGFGKVFVKSMIRKIENTRKVKDSELLGSIGIELCSQKTAEKILEEYSLEEILMFAEEDDWEYFETIPGIGEKKAKKISKSLKRNSKLIKKLSKELSIYHHEKREIKFNVCFTKVRDPEIEKFILNKGGNVTENLTKNTDFLVVPNLSIHSSKFEKAEKYGIPVILIDNVKRYVTENW